MYKCTIITIIYIENMTSQNGSQCQILPFSYFSKLIMWLLENILPLRDVLDDVYHIWSRIRLPFWSTWEHLCSRYWCLYIAVTSVFYIVCLRTVYLFSRFQFYNYCIILSFFSIYEFKDPFGISAALWLICTSVEDLPLWKLLN